MAKLRAGVWGPGFSELPGVSIGVSRVRGGTRDLAACGHVHTRMSTVGCEPVDRSMVWWQCFSMLLLMLRSPVGHVHDPRPKPCAQCFSSGSGPMHHLVPSLPPPVVPQGPAVAVAKGSGSGSGSDGGSQ